MLERYLCIRHDERKKVLLFFLVSFAWSIAASFGVVLSDALLIKFAGAQSLPLSFTIAAVGMLLFSGIFLYLYNRKEVSQIFKRWVFGAIVFYLVSFFFICTHVKNPYFFIFFKAISYIIQIGFYSCFWSFVDQYFALQNAKRLFGIFYSAIFLGTAVAGAVVTFSNNSSTIYLILALIVLSLSCCSFLITYIQNKMSKLPDDFQEFVVTKTSPRELIKYIVNSPFTLLLLSFCIMLQILLVITEYEYLFGLQLLFGSHSGNDLTQFLGRLYLFGSLFNIFFGVFIYGRLIKKAGLNNVILIVPLFFTSLFCGWYVSSHLIFSVMGFIAVEGVLTLVEDNNFTLLLNAVPLKVKNKIRIISESLIEPIGILISSLLMMLFQSKSKTLGLCLSLLFLVVGLLLRAYYTKGIFYNLVSHLFNFQSDSHTIKKPVSKKDYHQSKSEFIHQFLGLKSNEQFFLVECALKFNDTPFLETLLNKISKLSDSIKVQVMDALCDYPQTISDNFLPLMNQWAKKSPELHNHLIFHKAKMGLIDLSHFQEDTPNLHYKVSKYLLTLKKNSNSLASKEVFAEMLASSSEEEITLAVESLRFLPDHTFTSKLIELLLSKQNLRHVLLKTLVASLQSVDAPFLSTLLIELENEKHIPYRKLLLTCISKVLNEQNFETVLLHSAHWKIFERKELLNIALKLKFSIESTLISSLENKSYPDKTRLLSGQILAKLNRKLLKISFERLFNYEIRRAYLYYYHFITIQKSYPYTNLDLLQQALKNTYDSILDFIIQIQAHIQNFERGEYLAQSIHSSNPKTMSHAIETLQKICPSKLYKKLQPLVEPGHEDSFFKAYHKKELPILSLDGLLDLLENSSSNVNRMIVFFLKNRLNIKGPKSDAFRDSNFLLNKEVQTQ